MRPVGHRVHEVDRRQAGVPTNDEELDEFQVGEVVVLQDIGSLVGKSLERPTIRNGHRAISKLDRGKSIDRVQGSQVGQLCDVVDTVAINVGGVVDGVFLHHVVLLGQRGELFCQRGGVLLSQGHRDRDLEISIQVRSHKEHEVVRRSGGDHDGDGRYLYRSRRWVWTRRRALGVRRVDQERGQRSGKAKRRKDSAKWQ